MGSGLTGAGLNHEKVRVFYGSNVKCAQLLIVASINQVVTSSMSLALSP